MDLKQFWPVWLGPMLVLCACERPQLQPQPPAAATLRTSAGQSAPATVAHAVWVGKEHLAGMSNAAAQMAIWDMPQTSKVQDFLLNKASLAAWTLLGRQPDAGAAAELRGLLEDIVRNESYVEIRREGAGPGQFVCAVRLGSARAAAWNAGLKQVLRSLLRAGDRSGNTNGPGGWRMQQPHAPRMLELKRIGDWTLFGAADDHNALLEEIASRIQSTHRPHEWNAAHGQSWLHADIDLGRMAGVLTGGPNTRERWPRLTFTVAGEGTNVQTRGRLEFPGMELLELDAWNLPISLMDGPLTMFRAMRGFGDGLGSRHWWKNLGGGPPPNQLYSWSLSGSLFETYAAAPWPDASNRVARLSDAFLAQWKTWFPTNELAQFQKATTFTGIEWRGVGFMTPSLRSTTLTNGEFAYFSSFPNQPMSSPPQNYFNEALDSPDLVYYHWELTGERLPQLLFAMQFARHVTYLPQVPFDSSVLAWLEALGPKLGPSVTRVFQVGHGRFTFDRVSGIGLSALDLHLFADWLESPRFPRGLHTFTAPQ